MARRRKKSDDKIDPRRFWICEYESCSCVYEGEHPPDECQYCGHRYFLNALDEYGPNWLQ